ncbi:MAG: DASS family sodium-coupled anion symporter [Negativicutes bacterium]|nr:DASS family sodium-coupled anion symporter [Negativicutes bacterium]
MSGKKLVWVLIGLALMLGIIFMPPLAGLSSAGKVTLGVLVFAVIMWVTEAVSYPVSAVAIIAFLCVFMGFAPAKDISGPMLGTAKAIPLALSGFTNTGWVLVAAGLFMAAGILSTGLEKRIALNILKIVGTKTNAIFGGVIIVMLLLGFLIPSITARSATMTPIAMGLIAAFGVDKKGVFARMLLVCVAIESSISGILLLTSGAPNPVAASFIASSFKHTISWGDWLIYGAPYSLILSLIFYFIITKFNKFEFAEIPGGKEIISKALTDLGPMSEKEKRISIIFAITIFIWTSELWYKSVGLPATLDANTTAILSVLMMMWPGLGIGDWKTLASKVDWGTILLFGAGISLGEVLLSTGAAMWLAKAALGGLGLGSMPVAMMMLVLTIALCIIRFAFASITSATAALVPTVIGFLLSLNNPSLPMWGMTFISTLCVYIAFILPVNSPQAMIAYATDTFEVRDMAKVGIPTTIAAILLIVVFIYTYWPLMKII